LRVRLSVGGRGVLEIVRFAVVVPCDELDDINLVALLNQLLPACRVEMAVRHVDKLSFMLATLPPVLTKIATYVLIERIRPVMCEEPRARRGHVRLLALITVHLGEAGAVRVVRARSPNQWGQCAGHSLGNIRHARAKLPAQTGGVDNRLDGVGVQLDWPAGVELPKNSSVPEKNFPYGRVTHVEGTVHDTVELIESSRVDEE
jgi:hypothetical protein